MKHFLIIVVGITIMLSSAALAGEKNQTELKDSNVVAEPNSKEIQEPFQVVVYYLHMNRRCMTCKKLESYSKEAIESGFPKQLSDSSIVFKVKNFEQKENEHFAKDYQLYSQSLILSRQHDGKEIEWKNLDKIWELVGNKEKFISYVQKEVKDFLNSKEDK